MNMIKFSIIVPIYNSSSFLTGCLNSICIQKYTNFEVILVDDGSTDNSCDICKKYVNKDRRFRYLYKTNGGVSAARNAGIKNATGEYILFVDSDDIVADDWLSILHNNLETSDLYIYSYGYIDKLKQINKLNVGGCFSVIDTIFNINDSLRTQILYKIYNKVYCKRIILENDIQFDESINMGEDLRFNLEYFKHIENIKFIDRCLYFYRVNNSTSLCHKCDIDYNLIVNEIEAVVQFYNYFVDKVGTLVINKKISTFVLDKLQVGITDKRLNKNEAKQLILYVSKLNLTYDRKLKFKNLLKHGIHKNNRGLLLFRHKMIKIRYCFIKIYVKLKNYIFRFYNFYLNLFQFEL